jgi:hypothetical protein
MVYPRKRLFTVLQVDLKWLSTTGGLRTPRPLGEAIHAERPNQVLHFDFLFMGLATTEQKYILILKDDFSGFIMLHACHDADSETTITAL